MSDISLLSSRPFVLGEPDRSQSTRSDRRLVAGISAPADASAGCVRQIFITAARTTVTVSITFRHLETLIRSGTVLAETSSQKK
jgi:hypothetical protein